MFEEKLSYEDFYEDLASFDFTPNERTGAALKSVIMVCANPAKMVQKISGICCVAHPILKGIARILFLPKGLVNAVSALCNALDLSCP